LIQTGRYYFFVRVHSPGIKKEKAVICETGIACCFGRAAENPQNRSEYVVRGDLLWPKTVRWLANYRV